MTERNTAMKKQAVLLAESFDIYRKGIETILAKTNVFELLKAVKTGEKLISHYKKTPESLCLIASNILDMNIHELMQQLKKINPDPNVIILTNSTEISHLNQSLKAGVKGYLTKNVSAAELIEIIKKVSTGKQAFSKNIAQLMVGKYTDLTTRHQIQSSKQITKREKEILNLIVEGYTSAEIAEILFISTRTVETHRSNLMSKLELKNTAALVRYAIEEAGMT